MLPGGFDAATLDRLEKDVPGSRLLYLATTLQQATADLYHSSNRRTDAELCLLRLCDETLSGDLSALTARIQRMEDTLARLPALMSSGTLERREKPAPSRPVAETPVRKPAVPVPADSPPWDREKPPLPEEPPLDGERPPLPEEPLDISEPAFEMEPPNPETAPSPPAKREAASPPPAMSPADSAPTGSASGGAAWWRALAEECKGRLPPMYRAFLDKCRGELKDGVITVYAPDEIIKGRLDNDRVLGALQELGALKTGGAVTVRLTVGSGPVFSPEDKLQDLSRWEATGQLYHSVKAAERRQNNG